MNILGTQLRDKNVRNDGISQDGGKLFHSAASIR